MRTKSASDLSNQVVAFHFAFLVAMQNLAQGLCLLSGKIPA